MHLINKIFLGLTIVIAPVYFFFAGKVLTAQRDYRESCLRDRAAVQAELQKQRDLRSGADGIYRSRVAMEKLVAGRGRIWLQMERTEVDKTTGRVSVVVAPMLIPEGASPDAASGDVAGGDATGGDVAGGDVAAQAAGMAGAANASIPTQIELFEQVAVPESSAEVADDQMDPAIAGDAHQWAQVGLYLGQFNVKAVGNQWELTPTRVLAPSIQASLENSKATWLVYERMPQIRPDTLVKRNDGSVGIKLIPTGDDEKDQENLVVDYSLRLRAINDSLVNLAYQQSRLTFNKDQTEAATKSAGESTALLVAQNQDLEKDLARETMVYQAVRQWTQKLRASIEATNAQIAALYDRNVREVTELASMQRETLRRLNAASSSYASR